MKKRFNIKGKCQLFRIWRKQNLQRVGAFVALKRQQFRSWKEQPRQIAPMSQEEHECLNCQEHYVGSFCPRCGQAATTSRFSMKVAAENFAEAYGMGERGMFRTMRDLLLRPGYTILDYLRGKRVSYFAPFKMFFLLFAISTLVTHGLNIKRERAYDDSQTVSAVQQLDEESVTAETDVLVVNGKSYEVLDLTKAFFNKGFDVIERFEEQFPSLNMLFLLMILSGFLYLFFRHCPNIPDLRYTEFFIVLLYTANMYTIYSIVFDFFCLSKLSTYSIFLTLIPLKQTSGYSWWRTALKTIAVCMIMFTLLILSVVVLVLFASMITKRGG